MKQAMLVAALMCTFGCASTMTVEDRELLAADLQDALDAGRPVLGSNADAYVTAVQAVIDALLNDPGEGFDWADVFRVVRALEPQARQALIANGQTPEQADAIMALARIVLRRAEAAVGNAQREAETPPAATAPAMAPTSRPSQ